MTETTLFTILDGADAELAQTGIAAESWDTLAQLLTDVNVVMVATKNRRNITAAMTARGIPKVHMTKRPDGYAVWI